MKRRKGSGDGHGWSSSDYRRIQGQIGFILAAIIVMMTALEMVLILQRSEAALRKNASEFISADTRQLTLNINSYLEKIQQTASLMFASEAFYGFDATDQSIDEYDRIQAEKAISDRISDIALTSNFSDFGIIYADDSTAGWISQVTGAMYPDGGLYQAFASSISSSNRKEDGWSFGYEGNDDRLYYVKRLNPHAILVASVYRHELEALFQQPDQMRNLTVRFVDPEQMVFYSSNPDEVGRPLDDSIAPLTSLNTSQTLMNSQYLVTTNTCLNGWRIICSERTRDLFADSYSLRHYVVAISIATAGIFMILAFFFYRRMTAPVSSIVMELGKKASSDALSHLSNKESFQTSTEEKIQTAPAGAWAGIVMIDLDHFKDINDTAGHTFGDSVISRTGTLLSQVFSDRSYIAGRVGGDEFAIGFLFGPIFPEDKARAQIQEDLERFRGEFRKTFAADQSIVPISFSAGVAMEQMPQQRRRESDSSDAIFGNLYQRADTVLYRMKNKGRGITGYEWENKA